MVMGNSESTTTKNVGKLLVILIVVQTRWYDAGHHPMEHVRGFTGSHWMPPLGKCLRRTAPAAAMVNKFVETTNTNKTQLLATTVFSSIVLREKSGFSPLWSWGPKLSPVKTVDKMAFRWRIRAAKIAIGLWVTRGMIFSLKDWSIGRLGGQ
jgi:hypothetical protein